jgi:hypothetical protein
LPTISGLQQIFDRHGIDEFSPRDLVPDCNSYLTNCSYLEEVSGAFDLMQEIEHVQGSELVIPAEMRARLVPAVADAFIRSLIYTAYALETKNCADGWCIATAPIESAEANTDLRTTALLHRLASNSGDIVAAHIQRDWPLLVEPDYLYATYDVFEHVAEPLVATRITWCKLKARGSLVEPLNWTSFRFGSHFVDSLNDIRIRRRPNLKRDIEEVYFTIVAVLQGMAYGSDKHHALRNPLWMRSAPVQRREVRTSDGAVRFDDATRVEVTSGVSPLRIHYWRCHDGTYEFSNVTSEHDDPTIFAD